MMLISLSRWLLESPDLSSVDADDVEEGVGVAVDDVDVEEGAGRKVDSVASGKIH